MKTAVAMTFTKDGYDKHAETCIESLKEFWPSDVELLAYPEGFKMDGRELLSSSPECLKFKQDMYSRPAAHGKIGRTYYYIYDAVKWSHRIFALQAAARETDAQILINMDSDIVTFDKVTHEFLEEQLGDADIAYMSRKWIKMYSECSFVLYRLENPKVREFIDDHVEMYTNYKILDLAAWTDCHAFDYLVEKSDLKFKDINEGISPSMHPFVNGPLGSVMDHLKGTRKHEGRSRPGDLVVERKEAYWA